MQLKSNLKRPLVKKLYQALMQKELRMLNSKCQTKYMEMFDRLMESRQEIESALGTLSWERLEARRACRIAQYINFTNNVDVIQWGVDRLQKFKECFSRYL